MIPERTIPQAELLLPALVDKLPAGLVHARDGRVLYCNETFAAMLGEPAAALSGRDFFGFVVPEQQEQARRRYAARHQGVQVPESWEVELRRFDGAALRVEIEPRVVGPGEHLILVRDVSGALHDIELANRLSALAIKLQRERSPDAVLRTTEAGLGELGFRFHAFALDGDQLEVRCCPPAGPATPGDRFSWRGVTAFTQVFENGRAIYLDELPPTARQAIGAESQVLDEVLRELVARKGMAAPLFVANRAWGLFWVDAKALSPRDAATLALFAGQVAGAIENAEVIDELDRANRGLRAIHEVARVGTEHELSRVLPRLLEIAAATTESDRAVIFLVDRARGELVLAGSHGASCEFDAPPPGGFRTGPIAHALESLEPVVLQGLSGSIRESALVPLRVQGRASGVLALGRKGNRPYEEAELSAVRPLVAQLAIQVENARLFSETRRQVDMLSVLYGLGRTIAGTLERSSIADGALALLTERLGIDAGWIYVHHEDRRMLELAGHRGRSGGDLAHALGNALALDRSSVCGTCALEGRRQLVDLASAPDASPVARALGMRHLAAFPLLVDERLVGTLTVARGDNQLFREEELHLLESCGAQLAVALEGARLFEAERQRVLDLSRLNELGGLISQQLELPALLSVGVEHLERLVGSPQVFLSLLEPDGGPLRVVASNLREPGLIGIALGRDEPSAGAAAIRELRPVLLDDALEDHRGARALALRFGQRAVLAVPLISRGEPIGCVTLAHEEPGRTFSLPAIERAVAMANQLAAAIANARLFEEERHRVRELSLLSELGRIASGTLQREVLLAESVGHICSALGFETGAAWVVQRGRLVRATARAGDEAQTHDGEALAEALAGRALESGAPACEAAPGGLFACAVPLLAGAEVGGVLAFVRRGRSVTDAELRTLGAAAPELGVALQNARLFDGARRRVEELRLLLDIGRAITGSLDLDQILETSAGTLSRIIDGSNAFVMLLDAASGELRGSACSNPAWREEFRRVRIPLEEPSIASRCVRTRAPVSIADIAASDFRDSVRVAHFGEKSVLALPLLVRDEPIGCVVVDETRETRAWTESEVERATLIANQVAVAVANARLYDDLKRSYGELARTQEELVKRERLAALGELSAVVAHEVRNPLGVIFNSLGSMRKLLRPTGDGAMLLDIVEEEADRLDRIVRDLLDFARPHEPALEAEDFGLLLADTLQAAQGDRVPEGVNVEVQIPQDLPKLRIDARMIRQVLLNLVLNGMQAMPRGGTLRIRAELEPHRRPVVRIEVADTGTGVPHELAARIFQPFFTTKAAGTGLGLAVVKRFVEAHRGTITFHSRPGEGTTFVLRLPVDEAS